MTHRDSSAVFVLSPFLLLLSSSPHYIESMAFTLYLNFLAVKVASPLRLLLWIFSCCIYTKESKAILTMWDTLGKVRSLRNWGGCSNGTCLWCSVPSVSNTDVVKMSLSWSGTSPRVFLQWNLRTGFVFQFSWQQLSIKVTCSWLSVYPLNRLEKSLIAIKHLPRVDIRGKKICQSRGRFGVDSEL